MGLKTSDFDYELPLELIAQHPLERRDTSRLLVYHKESWAVEHRVFHDVTEYLDPGDVLVINDTRVIPARIIGKKVDTGGKMEFLLLSPTHPQDNPHPLTPSPRGLGEGDSLMRGFAPDPNPHPPLIRGVCHPAASRETRCERDAAAAAGGISGTSSLSPVHHASLYEGGGPAGPEGASKEISGTSTSEVWECLAKPAKRAATGTTFEFGNGRIRAEVLEELPEGMRRIKLTYEGVFEEALDAVGSMPLPPYIHEKLKDPERYQTVYARERGSAAAPTAGLHFTPELLQEIGAKGISIVKILLHVGLGTFRPVSVEDIGEHKMHSEYYEITPQAAEAINVARATGGKIVAVGTTSARTLETAAGEDGIIKPGSGWTDIFICPGYRFKAVDTLLTNFHLPCSTLLMMVSAFAGSREEMLRVYKIAVEEKYRFFSFGDAMMIL